MTINFIQGNCLEKIKELPDDSIDCVISSPPYFGLRDYGMEDQLGLEKTYQEYILNTIKVFETFKPKLKEHATIWWNVGDSYSSGSRKTTTLQSIRKPKSNEIKNTKYEYLDGLIVRPPIQTGIKEKDLMMIPNRVAIALQENGWYIRSEIIWHKPNHMPESIRDRPTSCHEKIWLITKNKKYYYDCDAIKEPTSGKKSGNKKPQKGTDQRFSETKQGLFKAQQKIYHLKNKRNVWTITTKPCREAHFATFPMDLIEPCVLAGCKEGGTILDPFGGAGTTGLVAYKHNRNAILIELNPKYIDISKKRFEKIFGVLI